MEDMMKFYAANGMGGGMDFPVESTLVLNTGSNLIKKLSDDVESEKAKIIAHQVYMLALLSQRQLKADELREFLSDSFKLLENNY
jgi:HSP90 family molecular chaperone